MSLTPVMVKGKGYKLIYGECGECVVSPNLMQTIKAVSKCVRIALALKLRQDYIFFSKANCNVMQLLIFVMCLKIFILRTNL